MVASRINSNYHPAQNSLMAHICVSAIWWPFLLYPYLQSSLPAPSFSCLKQALPMLGYALRASASSEMLCPPTLLHMSLHPQVAFSHHPVPPRRSCLPSLVPRTQVKTNGRQEQVVAYAPYYHHQSQKAGLTEVMNFNLILLRSIFFKVSGFINHLRFPTWVL